jgi:hypothetical protein
MAAASSSASRADDVAALLSCGSAPLCESEVDRLLATLESSALSSSAQTWQSLASMASERHRHMADIACAFFVDQCAAPPFCPLCLQSYGTARHALGSHMVLSAAMVKKQLQQDAASNRGTHMWNPRISDQSEPATTERSASLTFPCLCSQCEGLTSQMIENPSFGLRAVTDDIKFLYGILHCWRNSILCAARTLWVAEPWRAFDWVRSVLRYHFRMCEDQPSPSWTFYRLPLPRRVQFSFLEFSDSDFARNLQSLGLSDDKQSLMHGALRNFLQNVHCCAARLTTDSSMCAVVAVTHPPTTELFLLCSSSLLLGDESSRFAYVGSVAFRPPAPRCSACNSEHASRNALNKHLAENPSCKRRTPPIQTSLLLAASESAASAASSATPAAAAASVTSLPPFTSVASPSDEQVAREAAKWAQATICSGMCRDLRQSLDVGPMVSFSAPCIVSCDSGSGPLHINDFLPPRIASSEVTLRILAQMLDSGFKSYVRFMSSQRVLSAISDAREKHNRRLTK